MLNALFKSRRRSRWIMSLSAATACVALLWLSTQGPQRARHAAIVAMEDDPAPYFADERDLTTLAQDARTGEAARIGLSPEYALVERSDGARYYVRVASQRALAADLLKDHASGVLPAVFALDNVQPPASPFTALARRLDPNWISLLVPLVLLGVLVRMNPARSSGLFKTATTPPTRFDDVIGVAEAKEALQDIVAYLRRPQKFSELGARPPKGVILEGHFGCGKTLLARAVAGEAKVPFIALSGSDFTDMFLGVGVRRVKKLFALAREHAPCVMFIDEIDGLGKRSGGGSAGETENNRIINALLVELDGFTASTGIVVIGATNNVDNLDPALIRAGRFDRTCHLGLPDIDEREAIFNLHAGTIRLACAPDFRALARISTGLPPAAISNVVNAAALLAAKEDAPAVSPEHLQRTLEQHLMGGAAVPGQAALGADERRRIAVHEAGHALVARLHNVGIIEKVSILKRGRALGVTLVTNDQDLTLQSEPQLRSRMMMLLGGRVAEALVLKSVSTGAANDLEHVSSMAYRMVTEFGFSKTIGPFSYAGLPERERQLGSPPEAVSEARAIVKGIESECEEVLLAHRDALDRLTSELLEHETVPGGMVDACLRGAEPVALAA